MMTRRFVVGAVLWCLVASTAVLGTPAQAESVPVATALQEVRAACRLSSRIVEREGVVMWESPAWKTDWDRPDTEYGGWVRYVFHRSGLNRQLSTYFTRMKSRDSSQLEPDMLLRGSRYWDGAGQFSRNSFLLDLPQISLAEIRTAIHRPSLRWVPRYNAQWVRRYLAEWGEGLAPLAYLQVCSDRSDLSDVGRATYTDATRSMVGDRIVLTFGVDYAFWPDPVRHRVTVVTSRDGTIVRSSAPVFQFGSDPDGDDSYPLFEYDYVREQIWRYRPTPIRAPRPSEVIAKKDLCRRLKAAGKRPDC